MGGGEGKRLSFLITSGCSGHSVGLFVESLVIIRSYNSSKSVLSKQIETLLLHRTLSVVDA